MNVRDLATLITALSVALGAAWTVWTGRKQSRHDDSMGLWQDAMQIIDRLREENETLKDQIWFLEHPRATTRRKPGGNYATRRSTRSRTEEQ